MDNNLQDTLYYIQNGYVGNAILWWAIDSRGYTTELEKAGKFTKEEAEGIIKRPEDIAWPCDYIDSRTRAHKVIVDSQYLDSSYKVTGNTK